MSPDTGRGSEGPDVRLRQALHDLREHLSDRLAPQRMADSLPALLAAPPDVVAREIHAWAGAESGSASRSDYLSLGMRRVLALGSLRLVANEQLTDFVRRVGESLLALASPLDRQRLSSLLSLLPRSAGAGEAKPARVADPTVSADGPLPPHSSQRLTLILDRLDVAMAGPAARPKRELLVEAMLTTALDARNPAKLEEGLYSLRRLGFFRNTDEMIRALVETLPSWGVPATLVTMPPAILALERLVSFAPDPAEGARRFRELVHAALDEFNQGAVGRAARVFELAEQMIESHDVDAQLVEALRAHGHEYLNLDRVRRLLEGKDRATFPAVVLRFFRVFAPASLLEKLGREPRRERRRLLLAFVETHGRAGRSAAFERLTRLPEDEHDFFLLRNLVHLLRTISRTSEAPGELERELGRVVRLLVPENPNFLVREVLAYLGQIRHPVAEQVLILFLRNLEESLRSPSADTWAEDRDRWLAYLDRTAPEVARARTPNAWGVLVEHGLRTEESLGNCAARLVPLADQDLSATPHLVARLVAAIQAALPRGVLASLPAASAERLKHLVTALSGTRSPEVKELLESLAARFARHELGVTAARALAAMDAVPAPTTSVVPNLSGDLQLFGLPSVLQNLADARVTGALSILGARGENSATVTLEGGRVTNARFGPLTGIDAVHQLLERPFAGTFSFSHRQAAADAAPPRGGEPQETTKLILEGMRRHDELRRAILLVPDDAMLEATGEPPTAVPGETDIDFMTALWEKAAAGATPGECEEALRVDSFRVRHGLVHWLEEGALASTRRGRT